MDLNPTDAASIDLTKTAGTSPPDTLAEQIARLEAAERDERAEMGLPAGGPDDPTELLRILSTGSPKTWRTDYAVLTRDLAQRGAPDSLVLRFMEHWLTLSVPDASMRNKVLPDIRDVLADERVRLAKEAAERAKREWGSNPEPLPDALLPVPAFETATMLPPAFATWVADAAERMQCPPEYIAVPLLVALGSVVGRQCGIRPQAKDDWTVIPNLWGANIGPPGAMKSPGLKEGLAALAQLAADAEAAWDAGASLRKFEQVERDGERKELIKQIEKKKPGAGEDVYDRESAQKALAALDAAETALPTQRRFSTNDTTVEALAGLMAQNPIGFLVKRDELPGWFSYMEREGHENDRAFYIECWDGDGDYQFDRASRKGERLTGMCLSVFGGIQPGPLKEHLREAFGSGLSNDGMIQRFQLMVWPDIADDWTDQDREPDADARAGSIDVFRALANLVAETNPGPVPFLRFDPEAQAAFKAWRLPFERRIKRLQKAGVSDVLIEHLSKYRSLIPALALLLHLAAGGRGPVTLAATQQALLWADYLEPHARRVYQSITDTASATVALLDDRIRSGRLGACFTLRDVTQHEWAGLGRRQTGAVEDALDMLADLGRVKRVSRKADSGRPTVDYHVHPALLRAGRS